MFCLKPRTLAIVRRFSSAQLKIVPKSSSALDQALKYKIGDKVSGYLVKQVTEIPELQLVALRLQHEKTGADHLHVARDDSNNLFSVAFKTIPKNSRGVPHILEHLVLCGSQRFPCRDPFMKMLTRSLSTFMNAFTGSDCTMYPFSTQNLKDFENLLHVYLDAVFFPCLREKDFQQEGWRLDHEIPGDQNSPIIIKGVVFNEMKGVFSDSNQYYAQSLLRNLYPTNAYSHVSGGDPYCIPELTLEELKSFHAEHYHPSNSRFFTYGNFPMESHLQVIHDHVLKKFTKNLLKSEVISEKYWLKPRKAEIHSRFDPMAAIPEKQTIMSLNYLLNEITDTRDSFIMSILGNLLTDGPNAPFYKSLIEPGIGADYSPYAGYEGDLKQGFFSIGLREMHEKDIGLVESIIQKTFEEIVKTGFAQDRIEGILHNIELSMKHQSTKFGLHTAMSINNLWNHGGDPIEMLKVNSYIQWFQKQLQDDPFYLQRKVDQHFQKNGHQLCLIMTPDETAERIRENKENLILQSKLALLQPEDKIKILKDGIELAKYQQAVEDLSSLPSLKISDVEREMETTPLCVENISDVPVQLCEQPTNGVTYFKALCKVPELPEDLLMLLPLFSEVITKMGAGDMDYKQFDQEAELKTGGLSASVFLSAHPSLQNKYEHGILFSSHSLQKNVDHMMNLWQAIFNSVILSDVDRLSQLIKIAAADLAQSIPQSGHLYAMMKASSCLNKCSSLQERMSGLAQVSFMKKLAEQSNYDEVVAKLKILSEVILKKDVMRCSLNSNSESMPSSITGLGKFLNSLHKPVKDNTHSFQKEFDFCPTQEKCHIILPFAVNYVAKGLLTVPYNHEDFAKLKIASKLLSSKYLHREIREKGGAYGGGAKVNNGGVMAFYSYRDPNVTQTLSSFEKGIQWLEDGNYSHQDIDEAKLGVFSEVDCPTAPGNKGSLYFLQGISDEMKQNLRKNLFSVTKDDIISVSNRYLQKMETCGITLIGPNNEISNNKDWIKHKE